MKTNFLRLIACVCWVCAGISSAAPASALAVTAQIGEYANCSSSSYVQLSNNCSSDPINYRQIIKFSSIACNTGGCGSNTGAVYVDSLYTSGRKPALQLASCPNAMFLYELDTCAC
jgi:hypothetical protein